MAISVPNQWTAATGGLDPEVLTFPTSGNWLIAVITCRVTDGSAPTLSLADASRNLWRLLTTEQVEAASTHAAAQLQVEVWACPAARYDGWKYLAAYAAAMAISTDDVGSLCVNFVEVAGMANGYLTVDSVTVATATNANSITLTAPSPSGGANCLMIAAAAGDIAYGSYTTVGTGWTQLNNLTRTGPELGTFAAWREGTTGSSVTFSLVAGFNRNWAGVIVAIRTTGVAPAQPNPNWPATSFQVGLGYTMATPIGRVRWTDQTSRLLELSGERGIQAELGVAQQGQSDITIRNDDGAYTARAAGSATANATGTTTTIKIPDSQAGNIVAGDFFQLLTSGGALKQFTVFQVTGTASSGGTTTITFKRADGAAGGALAATATADQYTGIGVDLYMPYRLLMTWGGKTYIVSSGWMRDHVITYDGAHWSRDQAEAVDALEPLSTNADTSPLRSEILRRNPYAYWPLDDPQGVTYAANASGISVSILEQTASKFGVGANQTVGFGASTQQVATGAGFTTGNVGDPGNGWQQAGLTAAEGAASKGYALVGSDPGMPPITSGVTIFGVLLTTDTNTSVLGYNATVCILRNSDPAAGVGQGSIIKLSIHDNTGGLGGRAQVTVWDKATHATTTTVGPTSLGGVTSQAVPWAITLTPTGWTAYVSMQSWSGSGNFVGTWSGIDIGGEADQFAHGRCFNGVHGHIAVFPRVLTAGEISSLSAAAMWGLSNEPVNNRIQRRLDVSGWRGGRALASTPISADADVADSDIATATSNIALYEDAQTFVDASGALQFRSRQASYYQLPRATLGENTGAGEIPYQEGLSPSYNPSFIYNTVQIDNQHLPGYGRIDTTTLVAVDDGAVARYRTRSLQRATRLINTQDAWHLSWWLLARYAYPAKRVETVTVEASTDPTRWALVLGIEVGDIVIVQKRPLGAPAYSFRCRVLRVQPHFLWQHSGQVTGSITLTLAAAPPVVPIANDSTYGTVGATVMGA